MPLPEWHQGDPQQQWLNAQSASNPAMPPIGWSAQQSMLTNGNGQQSKNGQYGGNDVQGIAGNLWVFFSVDRTLIRINISNISLEFLSC